MIGPIPRRPSGSDAQSIFMQWVWDSLRALRICETPNTGTNRTTKGDFLIVNPGVGGAQLQTFRFKSMKGDYLICRAWNGSVEGSSDIYLAKPVKLRHSITSETIDGTAYTYSSYSLTAQTRVSAPASGSAETQIVVPRYLPNDLIYAMAAPTYVQSEDVPAKAVSLIDVNLDGRAWCQA